VEQTDAEIDDAAFRDGVHPRAGTAAERQSLSYGFAAPPLGKVAGA
jgi:hypothetical protein